MIRSERKVTFPVLIDKDLGGSIEVILGESYGRVTIMQRCGQEVTGKVRIYKEELDDVIAALIEAKKRLEEKEK